LGADGGTGFVSGTGGDIVYKHCGTRLSGHLCNALAHGTCAHHGDLLKVFIHIEELWPTSPQSQW
jgi:hypothetical protein